MTTFLLGAIFGLALGSLVSGMAQASSARARIARLAEIDAHNAAVERQLLDHIRYLETALGTGTGTTGTPTAFDTGIGMQRGVTITGKDDASIIRRLLGEDTGS